MTIELSLDEVHGLADWLIQCREAKPVESTTFAPPFVRPEPNTNLPGSLAALQNGGRPQSPGGSIGAWGKKCKAWLEQLPDGYREQALENYDHFYSLPVLVRTVRIALHLAFEWDKSPQGYEYWNKVATAFLPDNSIDHDMLPPLWVAPQPRIDVTDGQVYATADLEGVDVPDGMYYAFDLMGSICSRYLEEPVIGRKFQPRNKPLGFWRYIRYTGPLPEAEPSSRHHENGLSQGLPSAEELAELYLNEMNRLLPGWGSGSVMEGTEAMQTVRDAVLQSLPDVAELQAKSDEWEDRARRMVSENLKLIDREIETSEKNKALEAKVRELEAELAKEGERADHNHKMFCKKQDELFVSEQNHKKVEAENEQHKAYIAKYAARIQELEKENQDLSDIGAEETLRADKAEAQLAALGTPIDPSKLKAGDYALYKVRLDDYPSSHESSRLIVRFPNGAFEWLTDLTLYPVPNAPTE